MLRPLTDCFTPQIARQVSEADIDSETQDRINELATKANQGLLNDEEREEYSEFVEYIDLIAIIKAKARLKLHD
jgi:uncharacterized protein YnzC (UPF0291/DUF896 family)|tara:strand:- start:160 stop:381 length:222 start_codon:yes stop_codon:yes gene_type:complete